MEERVAVGSTHAAGVSGVLWPLSLGCSESEGAWRLLRINLVMLEGPGQVRVALAHGVQVGHLRSHW